MKKTEASTHSELAEAKMDMYRIRIRRVMGETVPSHVIKNARKKVAECVRSSENSEVKDA